MAEKLCSWLSANSWWNRGLFPVLGWRFFGGNSGGALSPPAPRTLLCAGSEIFQFRSAGGRWWCAMHGCRQSVFVGIHRRKSFGTHLRILRGNTISSDESSGWSWQKQCEDALWETPHSSYCMSGILAKVLRGRSRPHSLSWWRQDRIMALSPVVCSPYWDHVHSLAGLMLDSVTPPLELPRTPPLAMSHGSKSTLLLKKKPKNNGENKKSSQL